MLVTIALVVTCILAATMSALVIFLVQRGAHMLMGIPQLVSGLEIIFTGVLVNSVCIAVLLQIR